MSRFRKTFSATLVALLFLVLTASARPGCAQGPPTFQGEIQVREVGIVVEPPEGKSLASVQPGDFLVFEDGEARPVLKAEPMRATGGGAGPWRVVLYFDRALAGPETALNASLALARKARELTGLGTVEVVVADPEPRVVLAATGDAQAVSDALGALAGQARQDGSRAARDNKNGRAPAMETANLRRQLDRLVTLVAGRPSTGAGALFLVMDAFVPPPGEADLLSTAQADDPGPPGTATAALRETARVLAARGLVTFAVPMQKAAEDRKRVQVSDTERIRVQSGPSRHTTGVPPVIPMGGTGRGPLRHEPVADVLTRPESAPLMTLVQPTAGTVIGVEEQLGPVLQGLAGRWRVWFQAPESQNGSLRRVEVRLPSATVPLRGPRWIMAATPEGLASSRARLLVGGATVPGGDLTVDARMEGNELRLRVSGLPGTTGPLRVSVAFDNRSEVKHTVLPEASLEKGREAALPIQPPSGARKAAVVVEDLARGRWGAAALNLTAAPAGRAGGAAARPGGS